MHPAPTVPTSHWRFFPWAVAAGIGLVVAVNIGMAVLATRSFPGNVGSDGFTLSNRYNQVMQSARQDQGRGWVVQAGLAEGRPRVVTQDRDGAPLVGAVVAVTARRPLGGDEGLAIPMTALAPGLHGAGATLPGAGQWDLTVTVSHGGGTRTTTQRVVLR